MEKHVELDLFSFIRYSLPVEINFVADTELARFGGVGFLEHTERPKLHLKVDLIWSSNDYPQASFDDYSRPELGKIDAFCV